MDDRRRTNHTAAPHAYDTQPVAMPSGAFHAPPMYPSDGLAASSYRDTMHHAATFPPPTGPLVDLRPFHAEIARLRHLLASTQTATAQQAAAIRQQTEQAFLQQKNFLTGRIDSLQQKLASVQHDSQLEQQKREQDIAAIRRQLVHARSSVDDTNNQVVVLKRELKNVAIAASDEQQALKRSYDSIVARHGAAVAEKSATIETLRHQIENQDEILEHWKTAHEQAVQLSEWYESEHEQEHARFSQLSEEFGRFRSQTSEACAVYEDEIETLEATVGILQTDHEMVEMINADLDHLNDKLESEVQQLQAELETVVRQSSQDRQESQRAIESLRGQLHDTSARLAAASEEKKSLIETVASLKAKSDEFDATLFAKDQEIDATKRLATDTQRQLEQRCRENTGLATQNDQMRNRIRDAADDITRLQAELVEANSRADQAEASVLERDHQFRELQSAARAADANALLRASEAEQQYAVQLQRLEATLEQQTESRNNNSQLNADDQARISELEHALAASQRSATASSIENDRLQQTADQLNARLGELEIAVAKKTDRIELLQATVIELRHNLSLAEQENRQLQSDSTERRAQLADFADRIATAQQTISTQTQQLADQAQQLEQSGQARNGQDFEAGKSDLETEVAAKWQAQVTESGEKIRTLQLQLEQWSQHESPINEVKRLSVELSRRIADHAREREALLWRIEQLQTVRDLSRAA